MLAARITVFARSGPPALDPLVVEGARWMRTKKAGRHDMRMRPRARRRRRSIYNRWYWARTIVKWRRHRVIYGGHWQVAALAGLVSAAALTSGLVFGLLLVALA